MVKKEDREHIETARKYNLRPGTMKCEAFVLFDQLYSVTEVKYLLRHYRKPSTPRSFDNNIKKYYFLWNKAQELISNDSH